MLRSDARKNISIRLLCKDHERGQRGGNVNIAEDISPPPATKKKRKPFRISSMVRHRIENSTAFLTDFEVFFFFAEMSASPSL